MKFTAFILTLLSTALVLAAPTPYQPKDETLLRDKVINLPSGQIVVGNAQNKAAGVAVSGDISVSTSGEIAIADEAVTGEKISNTDGALKLVCGVVTSAQLVAAGSGEAVAFGPEFEDDAVIVKAYYKVTTTFKGDGDDSSTISLGFNSDVDIVAAAAIKTAGDAWDAAGYKEAIASDLDDPSNWIQASAAGRQLKAVWTAVATDTTLEAGSMQVCALYFQGV